MPSVNSGPSNTQTQNVTASLANPSSAASGSVIALLAQTGIPIGIAPTGTIGANGALTMGTALTGGTPDSLPYTNAFFYFPSGAVFSGSPVGFYYTKMSSTTAGTVYNNTLSGNALPTIPANPVSVVDPGPGGYTGATTLVTPFTITIPGNMVGPSGSMALDIFCTYPNSAGAKTIAAIYGGKSIASTAPTTTTQIWLSRIFSARGSTGASGDFTGISGAAGPGTSTSGNAQHFVIDTSQPQTFAVNLTLAAATDFLIMESLRFTALYGA